MKKLVLILALGVSICSKAQTSSSMMESYYASIKNEHKFKEGDEIEDLKKNLNSFATEINRGQKRILTGVCLNVLSSLVVYNLIPKDNTNASRNLSIGLAVTGLSYSVVGGVDLFKAYRHLKN